MKFPRSISPLLVLTAAFAGQSVFAADVPAKVTYNDHVLPLFKNSCLNCHNPDKKKAGLDLSTYAGTLAGSDNGKVLDSGNASNSLLIKCVRQTEDPKMPPKGDKLTDAEIALLEKWVTGQLLESANGKAVVATNNVQVAVVSLSRPDGPPPMPATDLPLEPIVHTKSTNALVALAASPWAPLVAVGGQKQIILYNTETLQPLGILPFPEGFPAIIRFSKNGKLLMTGGGLGGKSGKVVLWDVQTGERAGEVGNEFDSVLGADISPDQQHVALGGPGKLLKIYSTKDGKLEHTIKKHTDWITAVAYSPDGKYLASADRNGGIAVWEGATGKEFNTLPGHKVAVTALSFMPGVLASASEDGKISLWDVKEGKEIRTWAAHAGGASSVDFTTDGRLVSAGRDKLAKAWDQNGKVLLTSAPFQDIALRAVLAGDRMIAGDWTGSIRAFNLKGDGKADGELTSNPNSIAENLAAAEKDLAEAKAAETTGATALAAAEANLATALKAAQQQNKEKIAAAEKAAQQAQADLAALKASPAQPAEELKTAQAQLDEATKALAALPEAERPAATQKLEAQKQKVTELTAKATAAEAELKTKLPEAEKKQADSAAVVATAQKAEVKIPASPEALTKADTSAKNLEGLRAELTALNESRKKAPAPAIPKFDARIAAKTAEIAAAQTALDAAKQAASTSPQEAEVARLKAEREQGKGRVATTTAVVQRWQRAQAFMRVHNAKQSIADLQTRYEDLVATAKDALSPIAKTEADLTAAQKTIAESGAVIAAKEAAFNAAKAAADAATKASADAEAALTAADTKKKTSGQTADKLTTDLPEITKRQMLAKASIERKEKSLEGLEKDSEKYVAAQARIAALNKEMTEAQAALDAANKTLAEVKPQQDALIAELAKAKEACDATRLEARKTTTARVAAEKALAAAREAKQSAEKLIAEIKPKTGEIAEEAKKAKIKAEQDSVAVAKELETAKADFARLRTEYDAKFPAPPAPQPIAAK